MGGPTGHGPTGWGPSATRRETVQPLPSDGRVRRPPRHRDQGLPGGGRQAQGQDRAALSGTRGLVLRGAAVLGPPSSIGELNQTAEGWLAKRVNGRVHSTTGAVPAERLVTERQFGATPTPSVRHRL